MGCVANWTGEIQGEKERERMGGRWNKSNETQRWTGWKGDQMDGWWWACRGEKRRRETGD